MVDILAIDDDPVFRAFLEKTFDGSDYTIATAASPEEGLSRVHELDPALIVLDFEMPEMDGIELYKRLESEFDLTEIDVWMCSSIGDEDLMARAYTLGISDYVTKPVSAVAFRAKVQRQLQQSTRKLTRQVAARQAESLMRASGHINELMPPVPVVPGLELGVVYKPHEQIGGDFYDFFPTDRGTTCIVVGDVTGHGVEAAVIQTMARKLIQVLVRFGESVEHGLHAANAELMNDLPKGNFVAVLLAEWYPEARTLRFFRLGLPHPLLRQADGRVRLLMSGGTILGMHPSDRFARFISAQDVVLEPGDSVFFHTDGAIEASLPTGTDVGFEGLRQVLRDAPGDSAQSLADGSYDGVIGLTGTTVDDDITFLVVRAVEPAEAPVDDD